MNKVGVIGLGILGAAFGRRLAEAGYAVFPYNRNRGTKHLRSGDILYESPKEVAERTEVILITVSNKEACHAVLYGETGVFGADVKEKTIVMMATIGEDASLVFRKEATSRGAYYIDCPVFGSKHLAATGAVVLVPSGDTYRIEQTAPLLRHLGSLQASRPGAEAQVLKLAVNILLGQMTLGLTEACAFLRGQNMNRGDLFDLLKASPALDCGYFRSKRAALTSADFESDVAFPLEHMVKDLQLAHELSPGLPALALSLWLFRGAQRAGRGRQDVASV